MLLLIHQVVAFALLSSVYSLTPDKGYHLDPGDFARHQLQKTMIQLSVCTTVQTQGALIPDDLYAPGNPRTHSPL